MKINPITVGLFLASTLSLPAADLSKVEVRAVSVAVNVHDQISTFQGGAVAVVGDLRISAEQIIYDRTSGVLKCVGETKIETADAVITGTGATIDTKSKKLSIQAASIRVAK